MTKTPIMTMIIFQMPELEHLGAVGHFDSRATELNMEVIQGIIFILLRIVEAVPNHLKSDWNWPWYGSDWNCTMQKL